MNRGFSSHLGFYNGGEDYYTKKTPAARPPKVQPVYRDFVLNNVPFTSDCQQYSTVNKQIKWVYKLVQTMQWICFLGVVHWKNQKYRAKQLSFWQAIVFVHCSAKCTHAIASSAEIRRHVSGVATNTALTFFLKGRVLDSLFRGYCSLVPIRRYF